MRNPSLHSQLQLEKRKAFTKRLDILYTTMKQSIAAALADTIITSGPGAFFLQLDDVSTPRGSFEPVLVSYLSPEFKRITVVIGLGFESGKGGGNSAINVRKQLKDLMVLTEVEKRLEAILPADPLYNRATFFKKIFSSQVEYFTNLEDLGDEEAKAAALACYMFGGATTDGAVLNLLAHISGNATSRSTPRPGTMQNQFVTHHCDSHCLSLAARFTFGQKDQNSIFPPERHSRQGIILLNKLLDDIVAYSDSIAFRELSKLAKACSPPKTAVRMSRPHLLASTLMLISTLPSTTTWRCSVKSSSRRLPPRTTWNLTTCGLIHWPLSTLGKQWTARNWHLTRARN
jgi:hypothetical protein